MADLVQQGDEALPVESGVVAGVGGVQPDVAACVQREIGVGEIGVGRIEAGPVIEAERRPDLADRPTPSR